MTHHLREAVIDLAAIRHNTAVLREASGGAGVMAVVKADAYGHGLLPVARAVVDGGASWLGVALLSEALTLRAAGITQPMLAWLTGSGEDYPAAISAGIDLSAGSVGDLMAISEAARQCGQPAHVHLDIDTGLGRAGCPAAEWHDLCTQARKAEIDGAVVVTGTWSHFAYADAPGHPTIDRQISAFDGAVSVACDAGLRPQVRHLANSAAILTRDDCRYDLTRPGLALYGLSPIPADRSARSLGLRPAMTLRAQLSVVKRVPAGHGVSYQHTYVTDKETTLGVVPLGYADGIARAASNRGPIFAAGRQRSIAGVVCMDQVVLDLDDDPAEVGDAVVLFGPGDDGEPTAQDWAHATGTISYEVVSRIGPRVARRYIDSDASE